MYMCRISFGET